MKIVVLEKNSVGDDVDMRSMDGLGELIIYPNTLQDQIAERVQDADVVVINKCRMNVETIGNARKLKLIAVFATGYDVVDLKYCEERGIAVANVRGYSTDSVAQHTIALALSLLEKLSYYDNYVKSGAYSEQEFFCHMGEPFRDLQDKTWGIVGMGNIGSKVAKIAEALGCRVIYYSTTGNHDVPGYERVTMDELCARSDVLSVHCPLTDTTKGMIDRAFLQKMKSSAILVNVARGPIVREDALLWALENQVIAGAGLDVLSREPMDKENPLYGYQDSRKLIITPHMAWGSIEARQRLVEETARNIQAFQNGEVRNLVTGRRS